MDPAEPAARKDLFDRVTAVFYGAALTISALYMLDVMTNGAVWRAMEPGARRAGAWVHRQVTDAERERVIAEQARAVVLEAQAIAYDHSHDRGIA